MKDISVKLSHFHYKIPKLAGFADNERQRAVRHIFKKVVVSFHVRNEQTKQKVEMTCTAALTPADFARDDFMQTDRVMNKPAAFACFFQLTPGLFEEKKASDSIDGTTRGVKLCKFFLFDPKEGLCARQLDIQPLPQLHKTLDFASLGQFILVQRNVGQNLIFSFPR